MNAFDEERLAQAQREKQGDGKRTVRDVALTLERGRDVLDR